MTNLCLDPAATLARPIRIIQQAYLTPTTLAHLGTESDVQSTSDDCMRMPLALMTRKWPIPPTAAITNPLFNYTTLALRLNNPSCDPLKPRFNFLQQRPVPPARADSSNSTFLHSGYGGSSLGFSRYMDPVYSPSPSRDRSVAGCSTRGTVQRGVSRRGARVLAVESEPVALFKFLKPESRTQAVKWRRRDDENAAVSDENVPSAAAAPCMR
ncbi:hypothetical protein GALMADRAFT_149092 [Galerina marginata CBS 339.88]|uniref:Uncharacterized protein n=1 Tax=Galerina marginata (strain CBS 339.88) TaxID=685588 RepID=A0A067S2G6_GALM3|nr:hypothetical protein GALMADRAFT_149092 [Galerina marginata CBS 339.88]